MKSMKLASALAAAALVATPIVAQAAPAVERAAAPTVEDQELGDGIGPAFIIIAIAAVGMAILLLTDDDDDSVSA